MLGSLCTYQPSINAFLVITILEFLLLQQKNEPPQIIVALVGHRVFQLLIALCAYAVIAHLTVREGYGAAHASLIQGIGELAIVKRNLFDFWSLSIGQLKGSLRLTLVLPIMFALLASLGVGLRYSVRNVKKRKLLWISIAFLAPAFMLLGNFGFLLLLQSPTGGPRSFIGFGTLLAASFILISSVLTKYNIPGKIQCCLLIIPTYTMIAFSAILANAQKAQKDYEKHIAEKLSDELREVIPARAAKNLIVEGSVGYAPLVRRVVEKKYRLLGLLVSVDLASDEGGGFAHMVLGYRGISLPPEISKARRSAIVAATADAIPLRSNAYYKLYFLDPDLVVSLIPGAG